MSRVTIKNLEFLVGRINRLTGNPETSYTKNEEGKFKSNIGSFRLDQAYGGIKLVQIVSEGGGIRVISNGGYGTRKELYYQLEAMITGLEMRGQS